MNIQEEKKNRAKIDSVHIERMLWLIDIMVQWMMPRHYAPILHDIQLSAAVPSGEIVKNISSLSDVDKKYMRTASRQSR